MLPKRQAAIYQLKVVLKGVKPPVWRRLLVPGDTRLSRFHRILQTAMGWQDSHLHAYSVRQSNHIPNEARVTLAQLLLFEKSRLRYEYDFGDSWEHDVVVEKFLEPEKGVRYPRCTAGKGACPPEDVGGVWGYAEFLEALEDPDHESHEEFLEWVGDAFDPKAFDLDEVNIGLRKLR